MLGGFEACETLLRRYPPAETSMPPSVEKLREAHEALSDELRKILEETGSEVRKLGVRLVDDWSPATSRRVMQTAVGGYVALVEAQSDRLAPYEAELRTLLPTIWRAWGEAIGDVGSRLREDDALRLEFAARTLASCLRVGSQDVSSENPTLVYELARPLVAISVICDLLLGADRQSPDDLVEFLSIEAWRGSSEAYGILRATALGDSGRDAA